MRITLFFCVSFLIACDDRASELRQFNSPPEIKLQAERGGDKTKILIDSVKLSNPVYAYCPFIVEVNDINENIKNVRQEITKGAGFLFFRGQKISNDTVAVVDNRGIYRFYPTGVGTTTVRFIVTDYFDAKDSATLQLYVFSNLPPVANIAVSYLGNADKYEYQFDGSSSYDPDRSFGGTIVKYIFSVGSVQVAETLKPTISYIFPGPGAYSVRLQVKDNDNALSKEVSQIVQVN